MLMAKNDLQMDWQYPTEYPTPRVRWHDPGEPNCITSTPHETTISWPSLNLIATHLPILDVACNRHDRRSCLLIPWLMVKHRSGRRLPHKA